VNRQTTVLTTGLPNPVLVEIRRGAEVESIHRGAYCIVDSRGVVLEHQGDIEYPVYARSAAKLIQALPLIETGAADRFHFSDTELALACASHNGEPEHVNAVAQILNRIGIGANALACGCQSSPMSIVSALDLARSGSTPTSLHHNCSGNHAGFLATARHQDEALQGYIEPDHPVQRWVAAALSEMTESDIAVAPCGVDGCGIPAYAFPLKALA
jgi:L-asparaginase II